MVQFLISIQTIWCCMGQHCLGTCSINGRHPLAPPSDRHGSQSLYFGNLVLVPSPGIHYKDFRDPTTAWLTPEDKWCITIGSKVNKTGISLVYDTKDFKSYELLDGVLHGVGGTSMWECVDFYLVSKIKENGLDTSENGPGVKHILKTSLDDDRNGYYAFGTYDSYTAKWTLDNPIIDVGIGLRYDYGIFNASKTFYDQEKKRRVLWGWIKETDSENTDVQKGWSSIQAIPRAILLDKQTGSNLVPCPIEDVERLRLKKKVFNKVEAKAGEVVPVEVGSTTRKALERINGTNTIYNSNVNVNAGAAERGVLGPFGILVLTGSLSSKLSSKALDVDKAMYCSTLPVMEGEKLSMRILLDHSIVESFAQGRRICITSHIYRTTAVMT
ncbi:acid beta-fructofuranosidase-like [Olea europaea subsp. europaea]|uniref:Acid beta-fructofuranosidase-like n=1 Tax=Olea europaea subsp. europaea TaxID=158383 RepID=A0A8S0QAI7_OLEEU|nr:acid beta-fructofuranosidase-like [Olea europaea subsp. europaea]